MFVSSTVDTHGLNQETEKCLCFPVKRVVMSIMAVNSCLRLNKKNKERKVVGRLLPYRSTVKCLRLV